MTPFPTLDALTPFPPTAPAAVPLVFFSHALCVRSLVWIAQNIFHSFFVKYSAIRFASTFSNFNAFVFFLERFGPFIFVERSEINDEVERDGSPDEGGGANRCGVEEETEFDDDPEEAEEEEEEEVEEAVEVEEEEEEGISRGDDGGRCKDLRNKAEILFEFELLLWIEGNNFSFNSESNSSKLNESFSFENDLKSSNKDRCKKSRS